MILASSAGGGNFTMIIILVVMIGLMYFMMIRPQNKEKKRMQEMLNSMDIGDAVLTSSGFYGVIIEITDDDVIVEFGNNKNCRIPMRKAAIVQVEKPGGPVASIAPGKARKAVEQKAEEIKEETAEKAEETVEAAGEAVEEAVKDAEQTVENTFEKIH